MAHWHKQRYCCLLLILAASTPHDSCTTASTASSSCTAASTACDAEAESPLTRDCPPSLDGGILHSMEASGCRAASV